MESKDEEESKHARRVAMRAQNSEPTQDSSGQLDSSLKRHTALIKRMKQSLASENRDHLIRDIAALSLEKYIEEIAAASVEGLARCKTDKDVWSAVEVISALHRRFPKSYTPSTITLLHSALAPPSRSALNALSQDLREKEEAGRVLRQRPLLRVASELALVGVLSDAPGRTGGEWIMRVIKELLSNDPSLASLPLLTSFLKSFAAPYLGINASESIQDVLLIEREISDRFKKMCEGYFEKISKKLVNDFARLQEQDKRNHEAYIKSGEIFEDRQQAYEKMIRSHEKLLAGCQALSDLLHLNMPELKQTASQQQTNIGLSSNTGSHGAGSEAVSSNQGPWEDEEERKFFEDITDLAEVVPKAILGISDTLSEEPASEQPAIENLGNPVDGLMEVLNAELEDLTMNGQVPKNGSKMEGSKATEIENHDAEGSRPQSPSPTTPPENSDAPAAGAGPSQLVAALLTRLLDATNRSLVDELAVEFAYLNSKAARKRLVKTLIQLPRNRLDLAPYYARLVATLNRYMPDVGADMVAAVEEEFKYLNKKRTVKELDETRKKNLTFVSALTKFRIIPTHSILHMYKVCIDDFTGINVENVAMLLEGCGRYLLRSEETQERMSVMLELVKRKQSLQHFDQRQLLLLENAYYQCNPPDRKPREEKQRSDIEMFIRHIILDVLSKKTLDKVVRLIRKLNWHDQQMVAILHKYATRPWKIKHGSLSLLAMLVYDLQRYHPDFTIAVVDQVLENIRTGLEHNIYTDNQRRVATMKYLGELYIYRAVGSTVIFDTLWSLVTFGHVDGRPFTGISSSIDVPDDFFRIRLVCALLDTCGMCFDRGHQKRRLDQFLNFFQAYVLAKDLLPMDIEFMYLDSMEALRPKMEMFKTLEEALQSLDAQYASVATGEDEEESGDESDDGERRKEDEEEGGAKDDGSNVGDRPATPDALVIRGSNENVGPSEEAEAEFARELAKLITDSSSENRKVDKRTANALWDSSSMPSGLKKKRLDNETAESPEQGVMRFTVVSRRGHKQQVRDLEIPVDSALAVQTRTAQMQDKAEQEQLKRLVLDYEQREGEAYRKDAGYKLKEFG